jgi:hypothetical protein
MKYAKLINGYPAYAPNPIKINGEWWSNPPASLLLEQDYKPVVYTDQPTEHPVGKVWEEAWTEDEGNIIQQWVLVEVPITDEDALVRYANELTGAEDETLIEATETLIKTLREDN